MNEIVQTWFPVLAAFGSLAAIAATFWVRSTSKTEAEAVARDLRAEMEQQLQAIKSEQREQLTRLRTDMIKECDEIRAELVATTRSVIDHDRRLISVEEGLKAFPTVRDISRLGDRLSEVSAKLEGITVGMKGLHDGQNRTEKAIGVINETLMQQNHR